MAVHMTVGNLVATNVGFDHWFLICAVVGSNQASDNLIDVVRVVTLATQWTLEVYSP